MKKIKKIIPIVLSVFMLNLAFTVASAEGKKEDEVIVFVDYFAKDKGMNKEDFGEQENPNKESMSLEDLKNFDNWRKEKINNTDINDVLAFYFIIDRSLKSENAKGLSQDALKNVKRFVAASDFITFKNKPQLLGVATTAALSKKEAAILKQCFSKKALKKIQEKLVNDKITSEDIEKAKKELNSIIKKEVEKEEKIAKMFSGDGSKVYRKEMQRVKTNKEILESHIKEIGSAKPNKIINSIKNMEFGEKVRTEVIPANARG